MELKAEKSSSASEESAKTNTLKDENIVAKAIAIAKSVKKIGTSYPCLMNKKLVAINEDLQFGYEAQTNYCMDFYTKPDGSVGWECITRIDANTSSFVPLW